MHGRIQFARRHMRLPRGPRRLAIRNLPHAINSDGMSLADEHDFVPPGGAEVTDDMQELSRKILVDKQVTHAPAPRREPIA
jgi:hypothetical protein